MIYGYIRVSSDKQTVENQRFEINNFCERENLKIDGWIEETISGTKAYNKRQLGTLLKRIQKDDLIICAELSRLGRNLFMIMEILNVCMTKECRVWTIKDNYRLGEDIQSKVLAFAFGLSAEIQTTQTVGTGMLDGANTQVGVGGSLGSYYSTSDTTKYINSTINAKDNLILSSDGDATILGANINAKDIILDINQDLTVESLADKILRGDYEYNV